MPFRFANCSFDADSGIVPPNRNSSAVRRVPELNRLEIARGRWITERDKGKTSCSPTRPLEETVFPVVGPDRSGHLVRQRLYRVVIGRARPQTASAVIGGSLESRRKYNMDAYIPLETLHRRMGDLIMRVSSNDLTGELKE